MSFSRFFLTKYSKLNLLGTIFSAIRSLIIKSSIVYVTKFYRHQNSKSWNVKLFFKYINCPAFVPYAYSKQLKLIPQSSIKFTLSSIFNGRIKYLPIPEEE